MKNFLAGLDRQLQDQHSLRHKWKVLKLISVSISCCALDICNHTGLVAEMKDTTQTGPDIHLPTTIPVDTERVRISLPFEAVSWIKLFNIYATVCSFQE